MSGTSTFDADYADQDSLKNKKKPVEVVSSTNFDKDKSTKKPHRDSYIPTSNLILQACKI